ncbi:MAG: translation initiation factor [Muribaculaceae bacterium]|nr:translation initiation factor [Muribaculaceae bacterium]
MDWKDALSALRNDMTPGDNDGEKEKEIVSQINDQDFIPQKEKLTVITDKKGRNGKTATIIEGFLIPQNQVEELARKLKQRLGVGGSIREGEILIQGDHKEAIVKFLNDLNFKTK